MLVLKKVNRLAALVALVLSLVTNNLWAADDGPVTVIKPTKKVLKTDSAEIKPNSFELGVSLGNLSIADFGTKLVKGFGLTYHINPQFLAQLRYGESDAGMATFEEVSGFSFLADSDRKFKFTQLSAGYQLYKGRSFANAKNRFSTHLYLNAGIEKVQFANNDEIGYMIGTSYKIVTTNWLTFTLNLQDHIFERSFINDTKSTHNVEFSLTASALF